MRTILLLTSQCNVCNSSSACEAQRQAHVANNSASNTTRADGRNSHLVCHNQPDAPRTTYIDCDVIHPTVHAVFPGKLTISLIKVHRRDDFAATGLAAWDSKENTSLAAISYDGIEQFYCQSEDCSAKNVSTGVASDSSPFGTTEWTCNTLKCYCIPGTTLCGGGSLDLTSIINNMNGTLSMPCDYVEPSSANATGECAFRGKLLEKFLGAKGLPLKNCRSGSCISQSDLDQFWTSDATTDNVYGGEASKLSGPLVAGLIVLGFAVGTLLALVLLGLYRKRMAAARQEGRDPGPAGLLWQNIDYYLKNGKNTLGKGRTKPLEQVASLPEAFVSASSDHLVRGVSGRLEPGEMMAILGPSGAGKTTLVDILAGRNKSGDINGLITLLGTGREDSIASSRKVIAYVDQDDALPPYSTVIEALRTSADLSLPENVATEEKAATVSRVIELLGLAHVANRLIGDQSRRGISGGERRRVSIGCALVARPRILIADEPLSGLDAFSANRVITVFRNLARGPSDSAATTVMLTIHQPSSEIFHMFDRVALVAGGRLLYMDPPSKALQWCHHLGDPCPPGYNVADHMLRIAYMGGSSLSHISTHDSHLSEKQDFREFLQDGLYEPVCAGAEWQAQTGSESCTTFATQFGVLSQRALTVAKRDRAGPLAHVLGAIILGALVGGCFYQVNFTIAGFQNRVGSIFFLFILLSFCAMSATTILSKNRTLMIRERANGLYSAFAWLVSFVVFDAVLLRIIPAILLGTILYWMVGLKDSAANFFLFLLIAAIFNVTMATYNMLLAALFEDLSVAILLSGMFIVFNIGFGGFLLNLNTLPVAVRWLQWLCPLKYALEAVASRELPGLPLEDNVSGVRVSTSVSVFAPNLFGFHDGAFYRDLLVLSLAFLVSLFSLLFGAIWWRMRERR